MSECTHASRMDILHRPGPLPHELLLIIAAWECSSNIKYQTDHSRGFSPVLAVLVARGDPFCQAGYAEQNGAGNDPEIFSSGGCDPGTGGFGGLNSPELAHSHLGRHGLKRKRGKDPTQPSRSTSIKQAGRTFACPYYLHDRIRHSDCLNIRLTRLSDVRQHLLERAHYQTVHCPVCGTEFQGRLADARRLRDVHIRTRTCEPSPFPFNYPGITEDGEQSIREIARNNRTNHVTEFQRWYMIWDFLFPGEPRPDSPFLYDLPEIQRVADWRSTIFDNGLWLELPIEPWTAAMGLEQRRAGMSNFLDMFIVLARGLRVRDESPVDDRRGADGFSYMGVNTPAPSVATADPGFDLVASSDSNTAAHASTRRPVDLNPTPFTGPRDSRTLGRMGPSTSNLSPAGPSIPFRPVIGPSIVVTEEVQQPAPLEEAPDMEHDPTLPSSALGGSSGNVSSMDSDSELWNFLFGNEDARADDNHDPAGED